MTVFAHAGHWLVQLLYLAPLIVLVGVLLVTKIRDRGEVSDEHDPDHTGRD